MDGDADVDFDDIDPFVLGLTDPPAYQALFGVPAALKGDCDHDADQDFDDIACFVGILAGGLRDGDLRAIPEPGSSGLAASSR